jgi:hypothetical protein
VPEAPSPLAPAVAASFPALPDDGTAIPPDTMGAVGTAHLVTMLNSEVRIHDRAGADLGTVSLGTFWTPERVSSSNPFDPQLVYDAGSGRWLATVDADGESATSQVWFAMSAGSDPTGTWTFWGLQADATGTTWADYPGLGANATWVAITNDMYTVAPSPSFAGAKMWVIDKASALAGGPLTATVFPARFDLGPSGEYGFALQPALTFGAEPTLYLADAAYTSGSQKLLRISRLTGTGAAPTWSVQPGSAFAGSGVFAVTNDFDLTQLGARQLGTAATLDSGDTRMMNAVFRNGRLWCTHTGGWPVGAVDRTVVLWYQLDPGAMPSPVVQSGVLNGGPGVHLVYPSIAANAADDALVGLSRTDAGRHPEAAWTARAAGDLPGTMSPVTTLKAGEDVYVKDFGTGVVRWGDFSATAVDPADDLTFWTIQEYAAADVGPTPDDDRWGTWWGAATVQPATASTTTTTLPCEPAQCADADPCTEDACAPGGGCTHAPPSGYPGATCRLDGMTATLGSAAPGELSPRVQAKIGKRIARGRTKLGAAEQAQALGRRRRARAKLEATGRHLDAIARIVEKAKLRGTITSALGDDVYDAALDAIRVVDALRAAL